MRVIEVVVLRCSPWQHHLQISAALLKPQNERSWACRAQLKIVKRGFRGGGDGGGGVGGGGGGDGDERRWGGDRGGGGDGVEVETGVEMDMGWR